MREGLVVRMPKGGYLNHYIDPDPTVPYYESLCAIGLECSQWIEGPGPVCGACRDEYEKEDKQCR